VSSEPRTENHLGKGKGSLSSCQNKGERKGDESVSFTRERGCCERGGRGVAGPVRKKSVMSLFLLGTRRKGNQRVARATQ